jgi:ribosomal protein L12E/L44/L45/RPP1/RPP2
MASEYVIAGRRALPGGLFRLRTWSWTFEIEDTRSDDDEDYDHDAPTFDDGSFALDEIRRRGNDEMYAFVEKHAGFAPKSVVTLRKAGWDFSRAAAEVLAAALDGVCFVDALVAEHGLSPAVPPAAPARSILELQTRIEAASREPAKFFERWAAEDDAAQEEDRQDPPGASRRKKDNDWSDV